MSIWISYNHQSISYYSSIYSVSPSAYRIFVTVCLQCLPPRVRVADLVVFFLITRSSWSCLYGLPATGLCTSFVTSFCCSFPAALTIQACSTASLFSLTPSPTLITKYVSPTAAPITFNTGLKSFLLADLFLSPSPTNNNMSIFVQLSSSLRFMMMLLMPSLFTQQRFMRVRQLVVVGGGQTWDYSFCQSQRTWSELAMQRAQDRRRRGIGYCYQSQPMRSWQPALPYLVLITTLSFIRVLSSLNLSRSDLSWLMIDLGSFRILLSSATNSLPRSVYTTLLPLVSTFSPLPPLPPSLFQNFPVSEKNIGTNIPCFSLATTAPKCVYDGWNSVVLFPFFSSPSPTIIAITNSRSVWLTSLSLTLKEMLAQQLQRDLSSLKGLASEVLRIDRKDCEVYESQGLQTRGGLGLARYRKRTASCQATLPYITRSLSPFRVRITVLDSNRASCCLISSMQS